VTDGYGIIPLNGASTEWPANAISLTESRFDAEVAGIVIPAGLTLTNTETYIFARIFVAGRP
jgi:hypothetical protein